MFFYNAREGAGRDFSYALQVWTTFLKRITSHICCGRCNRHQLITELHQLLLLGIGDRGVVSQAKNLRDDGNASCSSERGCGENEKPGLSFPGFPNCPIQELSGTEAADDRGGDGGGCPRTLPLRRSILLGA